MGIFKLTFEKKKHCQTWSNFEFFKTQSFIQNWNSLNLQSFMQNVKPLGPKIPHLGILRQDFEENCCHIWGKRSRICQCDKYSRKAKKNKVWVQNTYHSFKLRLELEKTIAILEINTLEFSQISKLHTKVKILKFRTKDSLFGYFGQRLWEHIVKFKTNALEFVFMQVLVQK